MKHLLHLISAKMLPKYHMLNKYIPEIKIEELKL